MADAELDIRILESGDDMAEIANVLQQVWGTATPIVNVELLIAISHAGGYVAGVFESGHAVGASFGFLADHAGDRALHSHVTGILPGVRHSGLGREMKHHQREWARERNIRWIVWTFDPLVRGNAWFNLEVLGAHVTEYLTNFYGSMSDSINDGDDSDRLVVAWPTDPDTERPGSADDDVHVATPDDIVVLRRTDPTAAEEWRIRLRDELAPLLEAGGVVTGFTRDGDYLVRR